MGRRLLKSAPLFDPLLALSDERQWNALFQSQQCVIASGVEFSLAKQHWDGSAEIRIYVGSDSVVVWVVSDYIR